jgi:hypothetical protein
MSRMPGNLVRRRCSSRSSFPCYLEFASAYRHKTIFAWNAVSRLAFPDLSLAYDAPRNLCGHRSVRRDLGPAFGQTWVDDAHQVAV